MRKMLPIGLQSFSKLIEANYLYVDKTKMIHDLVSGAGYFFLSRPRRFGKSLTLSTIKELFSGSKESFKGLWIENNWNWNEVHPVIHISFSSIGYKELGLEKAIEICLEDIAKDFGLQLEKSGISQRFRELIKKLSQQNKAVILIDEYDKPIIDYLDNLPQAFEHQRILKSFYSVLKDSDPYLRFLLITGVSKFSKVSIFSELNNLLDLTTHPQFSTLVGYTQAELEHYFEERIDEITVEQGKTKAELLAEIKDWYNGYSWDGKNAVYNPFSVLSYFSNKQFKNFWFTTGTPTFLIKLLRNRQQIDLENIEVDQSVFESYNLNSLDTYSLLFQTGYSTIKEIGEFGIYTMDYPNKEVKESMMRHLIGEFRHDSPAVSTPVVIKLRKALIDNNLERVIELINSLFKSIPYQIFIKEKEAYYHSVVFLIFKYLGQFIEAEVNASDSRIDAVVETNSHIYILEFKLDRSAQAAITQIKGKGYGEKFRSSDKKLVGIGINFSSETKAVNDWESVEL